MLNPSELLTLLPFFVAVFFALVVTIIDAFHRTDQPRAYVANIAAVGMLLTFGCVLLMRDVAATPAFHGLILHDRFATFFNGLFTLAAAFTMALAPTYLRAHRSERGEFYALVILATTGMMLMAAAGDLIIVFLGIEIMSISVYALVGFFRSESPSAEGSLKYFFLGAFASAILLYGAALLYGTTGSTELRVISEALVASASSADNVLVVQSVDGVAAANSLDPLFFLGMLLVLVGMSFKIALVPFHMWTPDAYTGAPTVAVGFMATAVKAAGFAALIRILFVGFDAPSARIEDAGWVQIVFYLALITIIVGNLMAIVQSNVKRMLAYSSIAHAGYALIGVAAAGYASSASPNADGLLNNASVLFYLGTYTLATIGAFGALSLLSAASRRGDVDTYDDLAGYGYRQPLVAASLAVFMLSSAGLPPTAGFLGKFFVFKDAVVAATTTDNMSFIWLVVAAVLASLAGVFYYLRVIVSLYMRAPRREAAEPTVTSAEPPAPNLLARLALLACLVGTFLFGVWPTTLVNASNAAAEDFLVDVDQARQRAQLKAIQERAARADAPPVAPAAE